jgi:hypothetical protein
MRNLSHVYAYCYRRAAEDRRMAALETNPKSKQEYLEREARWLRLAANSEFSEHLNWRIGHFSAGRPSISA